MSYESLLLLKFEGIIAIILFVLLFIKISAREWENGALLRFINAALLLNLVAGFFWNAGGDVFSGMYHTDALIVLEKNMLNLGTFIISLQAGTWLKAHRHMPEFYMLLLATLLGMFFMISARNLLMFYVGLELSTIPLAAMANFDLEKRRSSEGALKFIMSSAFSSGFLLFGISLLYGAAGSLDYSGIMQRLDGGPLEILGFVLLFSGIAFKISVVPFHLWTADVYGGSPVSVTSYLSVISKSAVLFVLLTVLYSVFRPLAAQWYQVLVVLSVATMLIGNLFALRQSNLKRLLAFSSITQVGFVLVGASGNSQAGAASVIYFLLVYLFSNLGAFGVIALISTLTGKETVEDYTGLYKTNPFLSWVLALSLFSLAGIPPTAGFFGKFFLLMAGAAGGNYLLLGIAALNMILSLYYYLRVLKAVFMDENVAPVLKLEIPVPARIAMIMCLTGILLTGFAGWIYEYIYSVCKGL